MGTIVMKGWSQGLEKVSLTKLQMDILCISLSKAKSNTDKLLDGEIVKIDISDKYLAYKFIQQASFIGAMCEYIE